MRVSIFLLGALSALALAACVKEEPKKDLPRPVLVRTVHLGAADRPNVYSGEVHARFEADLAFRVGGKLIVRKVNLGDAVRRGEPLARLDPQDIELSASAARAQVSAADADAKLARVELDRATQLASREFVSGSVVDQRRTALLAAQSRLKQAQAQASVAVNQTRYATLLADSDGVVTAVLAEAGQVVAAGQPVVRVAKGEEREVLIFVPEKRISDIKVGASVLVRTWSDPNATLEGLVREVGASADAATRTFPVRISVKEGRTLSLGATAVVVFPGAVGASVVLPNGAVIEHDGGSAVWIVGRDGRLALRRTEVTALREDGAVISQGLAEGDQVVVVGAHTLVAGMKVRPQAESAPVSLDATR